MKIAISLFALSIVLANVPVLLEAAQTGSSAPNVGEGLGARSSSARILVLGQDSEPASGPGPSSWRISTTLDYRHSLGAGTSFPGGGAGTEIWVPAGQLRLTVFLAGGAVASTETWVEDRPYSSLVGGEPVTFVRRVEIEETRAEARIAAGAGLGLELRMGGPWRLALCAGPCAAAFGGYWGAGARASASVACEAAGAALLFRVSAEFARPGRVETGLTAGLGASFSF